MKKFIDKETNEIVTLLTVDEARKIFKMYVNYSQGKQEVKPGRINLVNYLGDFVKYANENDLAKFYDILVKEKEGFELGKQEQRGYDMLLNFFEIYSSIQKGDIALTKVTSYISSNIEKQNAVIKKESSNEKLSFEESISKIFFDSNFDLKTLAKKACDIWNESLRQKIEENSDGVEISLQEEIAYQELLEISNGKIPTVNNDSNQVKDKNVNENENNDEIITGPIVMGQITQDKKQEENVNDKIKKNEESKSSKVSNQEEDVVGPIFVNAIDREEEKLGRIDLNKNTDTTEKVNDSDEIIGNSLNNSLNSDEKESIFHPKKNDESINSSSIRNATSDVNLKDAAGFFNDTVDIINNNNNDNNGNNDNSNSTSSESGISNMYANGTNKTLRDE